MSGVTLTVYILADVWNLWTPELLLLLLRVPTKHYEDYPVINRVNEMKYQFFKSPDNETTLGFTFLLWEFTLTLKSVEEFHLFLGSKTEKSSIFIFSQYGMSTR